MRLEALKVTFFFCSFPASNCQQLRCCCANSSQIAKKKKNTLVIEGKITPAVAQCWRCASLCVVVIDLQCSVLWPYKKSADWPACSTSENVCLQHRNIFWKEKLNVSLCSVKMLHPINYLINKTTEKHTNKKDHRPCFAATKITHWLHPVFKSPTQGNFSVSSLAAGLF